MSITEFQKASTKLRRKHTPAPWQAVIGNGAGEFWSIHQKTPEIDGGYFARIDALHFTEEARLTAEANAKLMASAPDLFRACEAALDSLCRATFTAGSSSQQSDLNYAIDKCRAAIAAAMGVGNG